MTIDDQIDSSLARIKSGVDRRIARRHRRRAAAAASAILVAGAATVAAAVVVPWPNAQGTPYIACFGADSTSGPMLGEGAGFDMRDPIGFCMDRAADPTIGVQLTVRSDLMACRLADGVAGVFPADADGCEGLSLTAWTQADAALATELQTNYLQSQWQKFGIPIPKIATTPSQIIPN